MDGYISNGDLFKSLKTLCGENLTDVQIQQLVDRTIYWSDKDGDGKLSLDEFSEAVKLMDMEELFSHNLFD
jgi:serine/threonine-protein phosphatase 2B regulatory subunit